MHALLFFEHCRQTFQNRLLSWFGKEIALHQTPPELDHDVTLALGFNTFDDAINFKVGAHINDRFDNPPAAFGTCQWRDKAAIDLKAIKFQLMHIS